MIWKLFITVTSYWVWWRLKSAPSRLFAKLFVQASLNMQILMHGLFLFVCHFDLKSLSGGRFKNACELLNLQRCIKVTSFNVCVRYFVCNFECTLWNFTQNILPAHWKISILFTGENLRVLRFKISCAFLNAPMVSCQCVNSLRPSDAYMPQWNGPSSAQIMACRLLGAKPLSEPMLVYWQL